MSSHEAKLPAGGKPTNPKDALGGKKLPLHLWPTAATYLGSIAMLDGALKYGKNNWRPGGVRATVYIDAAKRHIDAYSEGEDVDPDSGMPHLGHALACLAILADATFGGNLTDDRLYPLGGEGYREMVEALTPYVGLLQARHADKDPKHYTIEDAR